MMQASFLGKVADNHTAFIRIKTNRTDFAQNVIVPLEVEVTTGKKNVKQVFNCRSYAASRMLSFSIIKFSNTIMSFLLILLLSTYLFLCLC